MGGMVRVGWGLTAQWLGMIAMSVRKLRALIMKMNILQNYNADDRERLIGHGMWNLA